MYTCQYSGVQDSFCGVVHKTEQQAKSCCIRKDDSALHPELWYTVDEISQDFYKQRWEEGLGGLERLPEAQIEEWISEYE